MFLGKVIGTVVSTRKDERLRGNKLLVVQKLNEKLLPSGESLIAVDTVDAGTGELVIFVSGSTARFASGDSAPVDATVVGIVDTVEVEQ
ncbi:MAG: EutN/CcmL family microcompartment protein [Eubacteriaceae bacterium]|jgi:Carbon dioxide concentrating mechanism/carboxysome shell protein|nr:EutN/CcmL family microcompartment protein [Eubacteriaceae bacterium]